MGTILIPTWFVVGKDLVKYSLSMGSGFYHEALMSTVAQSSSLLHEEMYQKSLP